MTVAGRASWTAVVLAGQRPGIDALAALHGETYKALVAIAGRPMLARVVATLRGTDAIGRIVVLAQDGEAALASAVADEAGIAWEEAGASIALSLLALIERGGAQWPLLVTTADHPLLDAATIGEFLGGAGGVDLAIGVVERATILAAHPGNRRTYLRFADGAFSGANLFALRSPRAAAALRFWAQAEQDRKRPWRLFRHAGWGLALRAITRTIGFADMLDRLGRRLGLTVAPVVLTRAEAAIDVDKQSDWVLADAILAATEARTAR